MNSKIFTATAAAMALSFAAAPAYAGFIEGAITMSGDFAPTGGTGLGDAIGIDFLGDDFTVDATTGDFAAAGIMTGDTGFYQDFDFNPLMAGGLDPLWSIGGFAFALEDIEIVFQNAFFLVLQGTGTLSAAGFDDTFGMWNMTANQAGTLFNFSSGTTAVDEPTVLALMGFGLLGFGLRRRRKAS